MPAATPLSPSSIPRRSTSASQARGRTCGSSCAACRRRRAPRPGAGGLSSTSTARPSPPPSPSRTASTTGGPGATRCAGPASTCGAWTSTASGPPTLTPRWPSRPTRTARCAWPRTPRPSSPQPCASSWSTWAPGRCRSWPTPGDAWSPGGSRARTRLWWTAWRCSRPSRAATARATPRARTDRRGE